MATHYWQVADEETMRQLWATFAGQSLKFIQATESEGLATLRGNWVAQTPGNILSWCLWETEDREALEARFNQAAAKFPSDLGFRTEFTLVQQVYPLPDEASLPRVADI